MSSRSPQIYRNSFRKEEKHLFNAEVLDFPKDNKIKISNKEFQIHQY